MRQLLLLAITIFMMVALTACNQQNDSKRKKAKGNLVMLSSVSSDGKYAITTNMNEQAYLWDLENHNHKSLSKVPVNIYSAYFIKNSHNFIYQLNSTNDVIVQNTSGKIIKKFNPGFPTYGQVMSKDLSTWIGVDEFDQIFIESKNGNKQLMYHYCGPNYKDEVPPPPGAPYTCGSFMGDGKLFNLSLAPDEKTLFVTGFSEAYSWQLEEPYKLKKINKSVAQTINAISPDGKYVVVGDQQMMGYLYDLEQSKIIPNENDKRFFFGAPENIEPIKKYFSKFEGNDINQVTALRFIDNDHFIVTYNGVPRPFTYLGLYKLGDYWYKPITDDIIPYAKLTKYLPLSKEILKSADDPYPETKSFVRDQAMDTSPSAHVLVMGQANGGGIMVYRYDPDTQELKLDWAPRLLSKSS